MGKENNKVRESGWLEVCYISRLLTNQFRYPSVEDGLMWICGSNLDRRVLLEGQDAQYAEEKDGYVKVGMGYYEFEGYKEESTDLVEWISSGSGSKLLAQKTTKGWVLSLTQPENNPEYEGVYQQIFSIGGEQFFLSEKEERQEYEETRELRILIAKYGGFKKDEGTSIMEQAFRRAEED